MRKKYPNTDKLRGVLKAFNPYHGWTPVLFQMEKWRK